MSPFDQAIESGLISEDEAEEVRRLFEQDEQHEAPQPYRLATLPAVALGVLALAAAVVAA